MMMKPIEIANEFIHEMNPTRWNGNGEIPIGFDTRVMEFATDMPDVLLDVSFELYEEIDGNSHWDHYCELVQESSDTIVDCAHGYGVDSPQNIADTIEYLLGVNKV